MLLEPAPSANDRSAVEPYEAEQPVEVEEAQEADDAIHDTPQPSADNASDGSAIEEAIDAEDIENAIQDVLNEIEHQEFVAKADARPPARIIGNSSLEIAEQIFQVQEWLSAGIRPNVIRKLCAEEWGLTTRTAENRMQAARRKMVTDANVYDRTEKVGQMLQQLEKVLEDALKMRQGSNAIGAIRLQADLLQLLQRQN